MPELNEIQAVLAAHGYEYPSSHCDCGHLMTRPWAEYHHHVAEQIAPLLAAARAEERERVLAPLRELAKHWQADDGRRWVSTLGDHLADEIDPEPDLLAAARIARTAPSTDQATTPPGVTGGSGEDEG